MSSQRRNAVRQAVAVMPRLARVIYTDVAFRPLRLVVTEVSATGLQVRSQDELRAGDLLDLAFELESELQIQARVLRVRRSNRLWDAGCAYEGVTERMSEQIVRFIFARQREILGATRGTR